MPLRLVFDGKSILDSWLADRDKEIAKAIIDMRGHLDPETMKFAPSVIQNNTVQIDAAFQRTFPNVARVLVFRATTAPAQRTARHRLSPTGYVLQLLVKKNSTVVMPCVELTDLAVAFVFPFTATGVSDTPLIFIGDVGGNQSAVSDVHDALLAHTVTLAAVCDDGDYVPPTPAEYAALVTAAKGHLRGESGDFVPRSDYESLRAELVACNKRRMALELAVDTLQHNIAAIANAAETLVADARRNNDAIIKLVS